MLRNHDPGTAVVQLGNQCVVVEPLAAISLLPARPSIRGGTSTPHIAEREVHQIAESVGERQDLGLHAAFEAADGLTPRSPFMYGLPQN